MRFDAQPTLTGELLRLRPLREEDFDSLHAVASDPLIWEQHPASNRHELNVFREFFREAMASGGALLVAEAATGAVIGSSRYHDLREAERQVEIGWTFLARAYWGGRYNAELKRLMLDHAFRFVDSVVLVIGETNLRSRRAAEKIGAVLDGRHTGEDGSQKVVYRIDKLTWGRPAAGRVRKGATMLSHGITPILNVSNLEESFAWFEKLGWKRLWDWGEPPDFGAVGSGVSEIFLCQNGQGGRGRSDVKMTFGRDGDDGADKGVWMSVWVEDVDAVHRACVAQGLEVTWPPTDMPWRVREMHVRHPDGHVFRVSRGVEEGE